MFGLLIFIIVNIVFILFYLQVEPVFLPACLNKAIQITSCIINIGNTFNIIVINMIIYNMLLDKHIMCKEWSKIKFMASVSK